jgi:hypothetical protein
MGPIESDNKFVVGAQGNDLVIMFPKQRMSKEDAVNLACYLLVLSGVDRSTLAMTLARIENGE